MEKDTMRRVTRRLIPLLMLCYGTATLNRSNVSFAALTMNHSLGLSSTAYGFGSGVFFLGYCLFGIPSTFVLTNLGARRWIAAIMVVWGLVSALTALVHAPWELYMVRVLLGAAEAGFYPGAILYITWWFPSGYRSRANALFTAASAMANIVAGPISAEILRFGDKLGFASWQWLFVLESLPALVLAIFVFAYLTDKPADANWLRPEERQWLESRMEFEQKNLESIPISGFSAVWRDPRFVCLIAVYLAVNFTNYGMVFSLPQLASEYGLSLRNIGSVVALAYLCGVVTSVLWAIHSDKAKERRFHAAASCLLATVGLLAGALSANAVLLLLALMVAQMGMSSFAANFWTLPPRILSAAAAGGGIALINSAGNLGGFVGPLVLGLIRDSTRSTAALCATMALGTLVAAIILVGAAPGERPHSGA